MSRLSIAQLPSHVVSYILCQLDCIQSLGSAIISHPCFHIAFKESPGRPIADILNGQIPPESMVYAAALLLDTQNAKGVAKLLRERFCFYEDYDLRLERRLCPGEVSPSQAAAMSEMHVIVNYFTRDFVESTAAMLQQELKLESAELFGTSEKENLRIQRALYRFQLCCSLFFRNISDINTNWARQRRVKSIALACVFAPFPPWVNEQLACIHDHLELVLSRVFDDVAAHEIYWGKKVVKWLYRGIDAEHKQAYLSLGLSFLHKLDQTSNYNHRLAMFESMGRKPLKSKQMIAWLFRETQNRGPGDVILGEEPEADVRDMASICTYPRDAYGSIPFKMWFEAHKSYDLGHTLHNKDHYWLRRCGYVMWNIPEAQFDDALTKLQSFATQQRRQDEIKRGKEERLMSLSCKQRTMIYLCRGAGYWTMGDYSKVEWRRSPGRSQRGREKSRSEDKTRRNSI